MKCFDPVLCYRGDSRTTFRNWSFARNDFVLRFRSPDLVFDCGKCIVCRKKRSAELAARCVLHASCYDSNMFLTLTYDEKREGYHNGFSYRDIQLFTKRLRVFIVRSGGGRIEVFNVHEYGSNGKKHWHLLVFGFSFSDKEIFSYKDSIPLYTSSSLGELWRFGFSTIGDVSEASAMYQAQYMEKDFRNGHSGTEKVSSSKHSGLGRPYFLRHYRQILSLGFIPFSGRKMPVPRYFQKLAQRHWAHFHEPTWFFDTFERKAKFRSFIKDEPSRDIADYYSLFLDIKAEKILELEKEFEEVLDVWLKDAVVPDFVYSGSNVLYDLKNRSSLERF